MSRYKHKRLVLGVSDDAAGGDHLRPASARLRLRMPRDWRRFYHNRSLSELACRAIINEAMRKRVSVPGNTWRTTKRVNSVLTTTSRKPWGWYTDDPEKFHMEHNPNTWQGVQPLREEMLGASA